MKKKFEYSEITGLHLELTTKCNAMCPMCNRNFKGKVRDNLELVELSLEDIKKILPVDFIKQLKLISICGVYGEPICNKDLKKIVKYIYSVNDEIDIDIYTNGGLYTKKWWTDLANIMKGHNGTVIFGIDGVGKTHSLHRCRVSYDKVITNAKALIDAGGIAQWDFIVFRHNEGQVEEAKKISEELGFKCFQLKKTSRFLKNLYEKDEHLDSTILDYGKHPVFDKDGNIVYYLELPLNNEYKNKGEDKFLKLIDKYKTINNYFDNLKINCSALRSHGVFISAKGEVFPCCTIYQQVCYKTIHGVEEDDELNEYKLYVKDNLSAFSRPIKEIVEGYFFTKVLESFNCKSIKDGKPKSCCRACGEDLDIHSLGHTTKIKYNGR